jgi:hypothetical protein
MSYFESVDSLHTSDCDSNNLLAERFVICNKQHFQDWTSMKVEWRWQLMS